ncbi:MAG: carbohydrate kinase family protein [Bacteroidota bacterium]|nr:carbohydrate kinase family protein [Bacteroidota bacterium]
MKIDFLVSNYGECAKQATIHTQQKFNMTITVIGHLCLDVIENPDGSEIQSYGGIFFTLAALANLLEDEDKIFPVFGVGKNDYDNLLERLTIYPNIDVSGIFKFSGPTNHVRLTYRNREKRVECSRNISEPIAWKRIRPYIDSEMILINMISGFDITLETFDEIRMEAREKNQEIYLDVHCLVCGINNDFTRFYHPIDTWRRWLFMLHGVQMNEEEAKSISIEQLDESALSQHILALNTKALHITRGENGSTVFINNHKQVKRFDIPAVKSENVIDTTGCGDVFAAAYCAHYMKTKNIILSTEFANRVASYNAQLPGSINIDQLSKFRLRKINEKEKIL